MPCTLNGVCVCVCGGLCSLLTGLGAGAGATLFGELARVSTKRERTKVFSIFTTFRQVGLIFGTQYVHLYTPV